jgi:predicted dehydrogenase
LIHAATIIGLGRIGMTNDLEGPDHFAVLSHAKALYQSEGFVLEAGIDPQPKLRADFSRRYATSAFSSLQELPESLGRDVVVIAAPTSSHLTLVQELMVRAAPQAILLEKPMGGSKVEAEAIAELCSANGTQVYINYHRAVLPSTSFIRGLLSSGAVETPYAGDALISGDRLTNGSHMVDLLLDWLGPISTKRVDSLQRGLWLDFDGCQILMRQIKPDSFSVFELTLLAENGRLRFDGWNDRWWWEAIEPDPLTAGYECLGEPRLNIPTGVTTFMAHVYGDLAQGLSNGPSSLRRVDRALEVHDALDGWV